MDYLAMSLASEPSEPNWEPPRFLKPVQISSCRTGETTHYIPHVTPAAEALNQAAQRLVRLCYHNSTLTEYKAFLAQWQDPANPGHLQPNALAWFNEPTICSALSAAVDNAREDILRVLLAQGLRPGEWAISSAVRAARQRGSKEALSLMLENGCLVGDEELVRWCLSLGAIPDCAGPMGNTAMQRAASIWSLESLQLLTAHGGTILNTDLIAHAAFTYQSSDRDRLYIIDYLLEQGAPIDAYWMCHSLTWKSNENGMFLWDGEQNALHLAITRGKKELVQFLLKRGADVRLEGYTLETEYKRKKPVELAEIYGFGDIAALLREHNG
ncbi:MAG: hypothetical protein M1820_006736 [Bogoriella megaspora]|nr:MAG: hypothetical protein M1820_006736 [Bogoriella megaspora]